jgi:hypothetical protein
MTKEMTQDVAQRLFDGMEAALEKLDESGYCPCCTTRLMLMQAGSFAAHFLQPDELRDVLAHIAELGEEHGPPPDTPRH